MNRARHRADDHALVGLKMNRARHRALVENHAVRAPVCDHVQFHVRALALHVPVGQSALSVDSSDGRAESDRIRSWAERVGAPELGLVEEDRAKQPQVPTHEVWLRLGHLMAYCQEMRHRQFGYLQWFW
eukprot:gnl/Trimastix_PCT/4610.p2 GENE.gnl/Trimastix_PCT/4610~~gnl/Trimastix_PCT/4610.p2  ORF type:complete len:129 (-),score=7.62 gnl/Trimastix_PCT/4610:83-469(-)